jgi:hypothetical protein
LVLNVVGIVDPARSARAGRVNRNCSVVTA